VEPLVQLVAPFAPHIAEELWEHFGHERGVFESRWPGYDPALATVDEIELVVQVNGKVRGKIRVARDIAESASIALARADAGIARFVTGEPKKIIFVPGRLLNIVV
jgi:leucyl-tRNA synthetase